MMYLGNPKTGSLSHGHGEAITSQKKVRCKGYGIGQLEADQSDKEMGM